MNEVALVVIAIAVLLSVILFVKSAASGRGFAYRLVQEPFRRLGSLEDEQKSGRVFGSAREVAESDTRMHAVAGLIRRIALSQVSWFSRRFPTDKFGHHDYLKYYDELFAPYLRQRGVTLLEIGVKKGGSLRMWRELFADDAFIYGMDIDPGVPTFRRDGRIKVLVLDSTDADAVKCALGPTKFDIIIDDGWHHPEAQFRTFKALWPHLAESGVYVIEDVYELDRGKYLKYPLEMSVHEDPSGQQLVVLYPEKSSAISTELGLSA
jgi:hypothetical protein